MHQYFLRICRNFIFSVFFLNCLPLHTHIAQQSSSIKVIQILEHVLPLSSTNYVEGKIAVESNYSSKT